MSLHLLIKLIIQSINQYLTSCCHDCVIVSSFHMWYFLELETLQILDHIESVMSLYADDPLMKNPSDFWVSYLLYFVFISTLHTTDDVSWHHWNNNSNAFEYFYERFRINTVTIFKYSIVPKVFAENDGRSWNLHGLRFNFRKFVNVLQSIFILRSQKRSFCKCKSWWI